MGPAVWVPAALGAAGLVQSGQQANAQQSLVRRGMKAGKEREGLQTMAMREIANIAREYDASKETAQSLAFGEERTGKALDKALRGLTTRYQGANPAGDTGFAVSAQGVTNDIMGPFAALAAQLKASEVQRKAGLWNMVLGAPPGQAANTYFQAAQLMPRGSMDGPLALVSQSLANLFGQQQGAGGTGDAPSGGPQSQVGLNNGNAWGNFTSWMNFIGKR